MVPKIHAKGSSFKGAAAYLLHDKDRAETSERVAWTQARNLAVDDPDMGWRIMAATAMDQDRLKAEAGVKNTGRKSSKHVLHVSLAWHPDQEPSREDMIAAADQALKALGASDHQTLIVSHNDEKHAHVHLLINRVSPKNGIMLSSSNDRLNLSKWAEEYERVGGEIYCEDRVVNNAMRAKGEYVKGAKDIARHIFEAQPAANDNDRAQAVRAQQRAKDHALALKSRNMAAMQARAREQLDEAHRQRKAALVRNHAREINATKIAAREQYRPRWRDLHRHQASERQTFEALETSFFGRASNMAKTIRVTAQDIGEDRTRIIGRTFGILTNAGKRQEYFEAAQKRARKALEREQSETALDTAKPLQAAQASKMAALRATYAQEREDLLQSQQAEKARLQQYWKVRNTERAQAFNENVEKARQREALKTEHAKAASPEQRSESGRSAPPSREDRMQEFLRRAEAFEQNNSRDRGRDDDIDM